jgi:hypothetical protein
MVPKNWEHPKRLDGSFQPMYNESYEERMAEWNSEKEKWDSGIFPEWANEENKKLSFEEWEGEAPDPEYYMPSLKDEEKTHYMMYETTSEGTPISPAFSTKEELARWLADNYASAFAKSTATYEQWLAMINVGWAPSAIMTSQGLVSGVVALPQDSKVKE